MLGGGETPHDFLYYLTTWSGQFDGVRDQRFKFHDIVPNASPLGAGGEVPYNAVPSLYDLQRDNESHDLSARHPQDTARLRGELERFRAEAASNPRGWRERDAAP